MFEVAVALFVVAMAFSLFATAYLNLVRSNIEASQTLTALMNLHLSLEKLWRELKYGANFNYRQDENILEFRDRSCRLQSVVLKKGAIEFPEGTKLTDPAVVEVTGLRIGLAGSINDPTDPSPTYLKTAPKIITIALTARVKDVAHKTFVYQFSVAPINSVFLVSPCQDVP